MSSFPEAAKLVRNYEDQVEALRQIWRRRSELISAPRGHFSGLSEGELERRLKDDRNELDHWALLAVAASFEGLLRTDYLSRVGGNRPVDPSLGGLATLFQTYGTRARLDDIRAFWEALCVMDRGPKGEISQFLGHRHWLAHGRYWKNPHGRPPSPQRASVSVAAYVAAIQTVAPDFPL